MKQLFVVFGKQQIEYQFDRDFNDPGEFHDVTKKIWVDAKKLDPNFGTKAHASKWDQDADAKVRKAFIDDKFGPIFGVIDTIDTFTKLIWLTVHLVVRFWGIRGGESHSILWENIRFGKYASGIDCGMKYVNIHCLKGGEQKCKVR